LAAEAREWVVEADVQVEADAPEAAVAGKPMAEIGYLEDEMKPSKSLMRRIGWSALFLFGTFAASMMPLNSRTLAAGQGAQRTFATPREAVTAMVSAVKAEDIDRLMPIFGPDAKAVLYSGDPVADKKTRVMFLEKYDQMNRLATEPDGSVTLYIGAENWPFPIPIVKKGGQWMFDTASGKTEILYRRIGRNEFDTIDTLQGLVDAQKEYASKPQLGETGKQYAQKLLSDRGKHDGLYWQSNPGEPASPIGPLIAEASSEGYQRKEGPVPFHGYVYKLLRSQGRNAVGGTMQYMVNGKLTRGFAFIAYPVQYRNSGVMTFIVNQDGKVYQKDLGPQTESMARSITQYNPDKSWRPVE
jgi:Protein of unknown function (DUF2950)